MEVSSMEVSSMEAWIRRTFEVYEDDGHEVFGFVSGGTAVAARLDIFLTLFGEVDAPPSRAGLVAADTEDRFGWHRHFDAWMEQGIITAE